MDLNPWLLTMDKSMVKIMRNYVHVLIVKCVLFTYV